MQNAGLLSLRVNLNRAINGSTIARDWARTRQLTHELAIVIPRLEENHDPTVIAPLQIKEATEAEETILGRSDKERAGVVFSSRRCVWLTSHEWGPRF
jgi:hypothetical protein